MKREGERGKEVVGGIPNFLCSIKKFMTVWQKLAKKWLQEEQEEAGEEQQQQTSKKMHE